VGVSTHFNAFNQAESERQREIKAAIGPDFQKPDNIQNKYSEPTMSLKRLLMQKNASRQ
jgi:hypothetical protein